MNSTYGIPIACITFAILLLWLLIGAKGHWILKMLITTFSLYFFACLWSSLNGLLGWPTEENVLNKKIQILWMDIKEPNKKTGNLGAIYVWAKHLNSIETHDWILDFNYKQSENESRLYKLPYSRDMHKQAIQMMQMIASGEKVYGEMKDGKKSSESGKSKHGEKGEGKEGGDQGSLSQEQEMMFHQLPPPHFQEKDEIPSPVHGPL